MSETPISVVAKTQLLLPIRHVDAVLNHNRKWINEFTRELTGMGLKVYPSQTNFMLVEFPRTPGKTAEEAIEVCYAGWVKHCRTFRPDMEIDPDYVNKDDISVYEIEIGKAFRDHDTI